MKKSTNGKLLTMTQMRKRGICSVFIYGCERWTTKKAEHQRIDAFKLVLEIALSFCGVLGHRSKKKKINILCTLYQINSYLLMEAII